MYNKKLHQTINALKDESGKVDALNLLERLNSTSFWQLLTESKKIEIPIIQRDYAHGREDDKTKKIRNTFLDSLVKAIEVEEETLELDFVYGDIKNDVFQPLDGQQRLTTLFLLHWWLAYKTNYLSESKEHFKKFTYETRVSSREFCNELVERNGELGEGKSIGDKITDASWFILTWKNDSTIKAMLVMLDSIETKLTAKTDEKLNLFWKNLTSANSPITFHFKQLYDIGLTDDLYIKMNARGKELTDFENFKARFEKYINENEFEKELKLSEENKNEWKYLTEQSFAYKIDTVWTDLFWKPERKDYSIDKGLINFIAGVAINVYAEHQNIFKSEEDDQITRERLQNKRGKEITYEAIKNERIQKRIQLLIANPNEILPEDFPSKTAFEYLKSYFDVYAEKNTNYDVLKPENLDLWDYLISENKEESSLFIQLVGENPINYKQRILFYAQTLYLLNTQGFNSKSFTNWMRVIRNIVENTAIDSPTAFIGAVGLIKELSLGIVDIYSFLSKQTITSRFASRQVQEEMAKAKIITQNHNAMAILHKTEDTEFCKGRIDFPLYCIDFDINSVNPIEFDNNQLEKVYTVIINNFSHLEAKLSDEFKSAFLTIQTNDYYEVWWGWSYSFKSRKGWLLDKVKDLKNYFSNSKGWKRDYLKELVLLLITQDYGQIISNYQISDSTPQWKKKIIKDSHLINSATYILIPESDSYCKLAWQQRPSKEEQVLKIE